MLTVVMRICVDLTELGAMSKKYQGTGKKEIYL